MRFKAGKAELEFFEILGGKKTLGKTAANLNPETRSLLGLERVAEDDLDQIEAAAFGSNAVPPQMSERDADDHYPSEEALESEPGAVSEADLADEEAPRFVQQEAPAEAVELGAISSEDVEPGVDEEALPAPAVSPPGRSTHGKLFATRRSSPLQMLEVLNARYKDEWVDWEPETLWWALKKDFGVVGKIARDKIEALRTALRTYLPWDDWDTFENCTLAWNDLTPIFGAYQPLTPSQAALGVTILRAIEPNTVFGNEVKAYIAAVLDEHGFSYAPEEWFGNAQELLDRKEWLASTKANVADIWGKVGSADPHKIDWREDNPTDNHIAKLFVVQLYLHERAKLSTAIQSGTRQISSTPTSPPVP